MTQLRLGVGVALLSGTLVAAQETVFRTVTDAVFVDVSVIKDRQPVANLGVADFTLLDDGVPQQIEAVERLSGAIDISLLVERGRNVATMTSAIVGGASAVESLLVAGDRLRIITFDSQFRNGPAPGDSASRGEYGVVLFDAVLAASMKPGEAGRRHVIVVLTRGLDTNSFVPSSTRQKVLTRSDTPVHIIAMGRDSQSFVVSAQSVPGMGIVDSHSVGSYDWVLRELADLTGGRLFNIRPDETFSKSLEKLSLSSAHGMCFVTNRAASDRADGTASRSKSRGRGNTMYAQDEDTGERRRVCCTEVAPRSCGGRPWAAHELRFTERLVQSQNRS